MVVVVVATVVGVVPEDRGPAGRGGRQLTPAVPALERPAAGRGEEQRRRPPQRWPASPSAAPIVVPPDPYGAETLQLTSGPRVTGPSSLG